MISIPGIDPLRSRMYIPQPFLPLLHGYLTHGSWLMTKERHGLGYDMCLGFKFLGRVALTLNSLQTRGEPFLIQRSQAHIGTPHGLPGCLD